MIKEKMTIKKRCIPSNDKWKQNFSGQVFSPGMTAMDLGLLKGLDAHIAILDENGNICPNADKLVQFSVEGEGKLDCVGNGDPTCIESYQADERSAFHGLCLLVVRSTQNPGKIFVRASSDGIEDTIIEISTKAIANL